MKFRHEYKHQINLADVFVLRTRLGAVAKHDSHCNEDGTYIVKSLYFDNYADTALREKLDGMRAREKFRIRYYGTDTSFIKLEKKSKINGLCNKVSVRITAEECRKIINGDIAFMKTSERELLRELYAKMQYKLLRPKCVVVYKRECFVYPPGNVRVTIDTNIGTTGNINGFLGFGENYSGVSKNAILEVKWDEYLPEIIRDCVQLKTRRGGAFSKYAVVRCNYN